MKNEIVYLRRKQDTREVDIYPKKDNGKRKCVKAYNENSTYIKDGYKIVNKTVTNDVQIARNKTHSFLVTKKIFETYNTKTNSLYYTTITEKLGKKSVKIRRSTSGYLFTDTLKCIDMLGYGNITRKLIPALKDLPIATEYNTNPFNTDPYEKTVTKLLMTQTFPEEMLPLMDKKSSIIVYTKPDLYKIKNVGLEKYIINVTKGYGKVIKKMIYEDVKLLPMFEILSPYISNIDLLQYILKTVKENDGLRFDIESLWKRSHDSSFRKTNKRCTTKVKKDKIPVFEIAGKQLTEKFFRAVPRRWNENKSMLDYNRNLMVGIIKINDVIIESKKRNTKEAVVDAIKELLKHSENHNEIGQNLEFAILPAQKLNVNKHLEIYAKTINENLNLFIAKTSKDLNKIANDFNNCVRTYLTACKGTTYITDIVAVYDKQNTPIACIEITNAGNAISSLIINQVKAPHNESVNDEKLLKAIRLWIANANLNYANI